MNSVIDTTARQNRGNEPLRHDFWMPTTSAAVDRVYHEAPLWLVGATSVGPLVRAACDAVVAGSDGPALAVLAGLSVHADPNDIETEEVVNDAFVELERPLPNRGSHAALVAAAVAMAKEAIVGRLSPRDLARWAHSTITHDGPPVALELVVMDDVYDALPYTGQTEAETDQRTLDAARQLVAAAAL